MLMASTSDSSLQIETLAERKAGGRGGKRRGRGRTGKAKEGEGKEGKGCLKDIDVFSKFELVLARNTLS